MPKYTKHSIDEVKAADIRLFFDFPIKKSSEMVKCPMCGNKKMLVTHKGSKNLAHCQHCEVTFTSVLDAVMKVNNWDKSHFVEAVEAAAEITGVHLIEDKPVNTPANPKKKPTAPSRNPKLGSPSFMLSQLASSGLTEEDVMAEVVDGSQSYSISPFRVGRVNESFNVDLSGDDMLIFYYDLFGRPMTYRRKGSVKDWPYVRVRWANPDIHTDRSGKAMKYQTPAGASCKLYIPQRIRRAFQSSEHIETLFIQEGEKKAEKACKHGLMSVGIQGISNIGSQEAGLIQEIQDITKACSVKNIVLLLDSDWNDLHRSIIVGDAVDKRPNSFSKAVIKFKTYIRSLANVNLFVDVWFGHVNRNEADAKGVDDLLCSVLKDNEAALTEDATFAMFSHDGIGKYVSIHKITEVSDTKIRDLWSLNSADDFYKVHQSELSQLGSFKFGRAKYQVVDGKLWIVSNYSSDQELYEKTENEKTGEVKVNISVFECINFLQANGYKKLRQANKLDGSIRFILDSDGIVEYVDTEAMRDFVYDTVLQNSKEYAVLKCFAEKLGSRLADSNLQRLTLIKDDFNKFIPNEHTAHYNNGAVNITSSAINSGLPHGKVWRSHILPRIFSRVKIFESIVYDGKAFQVKLTADGKRCEFLQFLYNCSNNAYKHNSVRELTPEEVETLNQHIVNKVTGIGFLICDWNNNAERVAVVIQDHKMSEVGQSFGGSGKSLIGNAIEQIKNMCVIDGKRIGGDAKFVYDRVTDETRVIFIDDVRTNVNFESFYNMITGKMVVERKAMESMAFDKEKSPKLLITTNHAINGASDDSSARRIAYMEVSDWYNKNHNIVDDFGHLFFDDWDEDQWNLFDNFMAECAMFYLKSIELGWAPKSGCGIVMPPMDLIKKRTLRQEMSEIFLSWADEYFDPTGDKLNARINKKEMVADFMVYANGTQHGVSSSNFKRRLLKYCEYKGYHFNIKRPNEDNLQYSDWCLSTDGGSFIGSDDKSNGQQFFTVFSVEKDNEGKPF